MKCRSLRAYLDKELNPLSARLMRMHIAACPRCRQAIDEEPDLSREITRLEDAPVPQALRDKLMSDAVTAAASARAKIVPHFRSRIQGAFTMKRILIAFVVVLIAAGFGVLPGIKNSYALAQVANAMSNLKSMHMVITKSHSKTGKSSSEELWIKMPSKYRLITQSADVADDGEKTVTIQRSTESTVVTITRSQGVQGLDPTNSVLDLFNFKELVDKFKDKVLSRTSTTIEGQKATVFDLGDLIVTIDDTSSLPVRVEEYWSDGRLRKVIEHIKYNEDIPDSIFHLHIPKDALVIDTLKTSSYSAEVEQKRTQLAADLKASGAWNLAWRTGVNISSVYNQNTGSVGSPAHQEMRFRPLDVGKAWLFYIPQRNSYYVLGKWLVTDPKTPGFESVVQDREFPAPRKAKILQTYATRVILQNAKPGEYAEWMNLQNIGPGPLTIIEKHTWRDGTVYEIKGRAKHIPDGKEYKNETATFEELINRPYDSPYPAKLYWGNMSPEQIEAHKGYVEYHNRIAAILSKKNAKGFAVYEGAEVQDMGWLDDNNPLCEGKLELTRIHRPNLDVGNTSDFLGYA
ncbi:MAG: zf-HC2 domain-containing protein, partial [Armatimonadetes bacterium]|nr:zf-HC2 domain-containing protein [Armatimonadota bacterium]